MNTAADTAGNAARENAFWIPILVAIAAILEAVDRVILARDVAALAEAVANEDKDRTAKLTEELAITLGVEVTVGNIVPGSVLAVTLIRDALRDNGRHDLADEIQYELDTAGPTAFHHTRVEVVESIMTEGLWEGAYATPRGPLRPLQATIELALPGLRAHNAVLEIDLAGLRADGYDIPPVTRIRSFRGRPGGGYEMVFPYEIPPEYIRVIQR